MSSREAVQYIIGIDLGTTNSAVSYIDCSQPSSEPETFILEQHSLEGRVYQEDHLPSFLLYPKHDCRREATIAGIAAREAVFDQPERVIHSAKSWLCYGSMADEPRILPWQSDVVSESEKCSAVEASQQYLAHIKDCWNREHAAFHEDARLEHQTVIVTVPASFDERAQELTVQALHAAGYPEHTILLEEPLSALSSVLHDHGSILDDLSRVEVQASYHVLVVDIGGGTTDFSLFLLNAGGDSGIQRIAVGRHLLLGGDNIDLSIAHTISKEHDLTCKPGSRQWAVLCARSRELKERLFDQQELPDEEFISIPSEGSNLFEGTLSIRVNPGRLREQVLEGFFQEVDSQIVQKKSGIRQRGLPYEAISSIPYHIETFLQGKSVDGVIFNGGSVKPQELRDRLTDCIARLQQGKRPLEIENKHMAHAVSRGASLWSFRRQLGTQKIEAGYRASLYVDLSRKRSNPSDCLCICPFGMKEGEETRVEVPGLEAVLGQPVHIALCRSVQRQDDNAGDLVRISREDMQSLPPSVVVFDDETLSGGRVPVMLDAHLTATGRLQLRCTRKDNPSQFWEVSFDTRGEVGTLESSNEQSISGARRQEAEELLSRWYSKSRKREQGKTPKRLLKELERILEMPREHWSLSLLRSLADILVSAGGRRARSEAHELAWLRTCGYLMRPGFGDALDQRRLDTLWAQFSRGLYFPDTGACSVAWPIFWRRVAGGLPAEKQRKLFTHFFKGSVERMRIEHVRLLCALERVGNEKRQSLLKALVKAVGKGKGDFVQLSACLGRLLSRESSSGEFHTLVPAHRVEETFYSLREQFPAGKDQTPLAFAFLQAGRLTGEADFDLSPKVRADIAQYVMQCGIPPEKTAILEEVVVLQDDEVSFLIGDSLPPGLRLNKQGA